MSSTLILPGKSLPLADAEEIRDVLEHELDLIIDGGYCGGDPTTVIGWTGPSPELLRQGGGESGFISPSE